MNREKQALRPLFYKGKEPRGLLFRSIVTTWGGLIKQGILAKMKYGWYRAPDIQCQLKQKYAWKGAAGMNQKDQKKTKPSQKRQAEIAPKGMSVRTMGNLLGLKKVESYWLVHKNYFRTTEFMGKLCVDIEDFERWYSMQTHYHKVTGEAPGQRLKESYLSVFDIAEMFGIGVTTAWDLINKEKFTTKQVEGATRIPREEFDSWYEGQSRYRIIEREPGVTFDIADSLSPRKVSQLLGIDQRKATRLLLESEYKDMFEIIVHGSRRRVTIKSFQHFLDSQTEYQLAEGQTLKRRMTAYAADVWH